MTMKANSEQDEDDIKTFFNRVLTIDGKYLDRLFTIGMLTFFVSFLYSTSGYSGDSQVFPYAVGIPSFLLVVFVLLVQTSPYARKIIEKYRSQNLFDVDDSFDDEEQDEEVDPRTQRVRAFTISTWIVALYITIYILGFLPATFLFLLVYFRFEAKLSWGKSVLFTLLVWLFIVILFDIVLNTPFYTGVLDIVIPTPG